MPTDSARPTQPTPVADLSYEQAREELASVVSRLETGGETLEGSLALWERGEARPRSPHLLHAVARAVRVPVTELLLTPEGGASLRWLRFAAGLSVDEVAHAAHLSVASLKRWEAQGCRRTPSPATLDAVAAALGVPTAEVESALRPR